MVPLLFRVDADFLLGALCAINFFCLSFNEASNAAHIYKKLFCNVIDTCGHSEVIHTFIDLHGLRADQQQEGEYFKRHAMVWDVT